jgi:plasmid stabilization system protein ParE
MAIRYGPQVEAELDDIWIYIAQESGSIDVADRLVASITEHFFLLSKDPQLGRRRDEDLRPGLRSLSVGGYVVILPGRRP